MTKSELIFAAEASCRYHDARARFLQGFASLLTILSVVLGGSAFATLVNGALAPAAPWIGLVIAFLNAYRFVAKPEQLGGQHRTWARAWADLLADLRATPTVSAAKSRAWIKTHSSLNAECSGEMVALKAYCFNATLGALGLKDKPYPIKWRHRTFKNIFKFTHAFDGMDFG